MMMCESAVMEKCEAGSWQQQRICGWFREDELNGGYWGEVEPGLLRLYTLWQLKCQECVNVSYNA
jgi:hypothetical protein